MPSFSPSQEQYEIYVMISPHEIYSDVQMQSVDCKRILIGSHQIIKSAHSSLGLSRFDIAQAKIKSIVI